MGDTDELPDGEIDLDNPPFPLTEKDRLQLATRDEDFSRITWDDVQDIIGKTDIIILFYILQPRFVSFRFIEALF